MKVLLLGGIGTKVPSPDDRDSAQQSVYPNNIANPEFLSVGSKPRVCWASNSEYMVACTGNAAADQIFATRVKTRIAGGRWKAIAPVFVNSYLTTTKSPIAVNAPKVTLAWSLELANGVLTPNVFSSPNTGGTILPGTFNGVTDGVLISGGLLIGDLIYASAAGLDSFEFNDRKLLPWMRCAWSKTNANDILPAPTQTEFNWPCNTLYAKCTSFAAAKTLIGTSGVAPVNSGDDHWKSSGGDSAPSCIGFIGIGMDGQMAFLTIGTSILDGDGSASHLQGGVNPANNTMRNCDLLGWPNEFGQTLSNSVPVLNLAVGASAMSRIWSSGADIAWVTNPEDTALQRGTLARLAKFFDIAVPYDPQNDSAGTFPECIANFCGAMRSANPFMRIYSVIVPNGYTDENGATSVWQAANDAKYAMYDTALALGYIHGILDLRLMPTKEFPDLGVQVARNTTSDGTATTLNDSGVTWYQNQWINSFVRIGGVVKRITGNTRTQLGFNAFGGAILSGTPYEILGNTTGDGLHPDNFGQVWLAAQFKSKIAMFERIPYFTRTD